MQVGVMFAIVIHHGGAAVRIVIEMHRIAALGKMRKELTVHGVQRGYACGELTDSFTLGVIAKQNHAIRHTGRQSSASAPDEHHIVIARNIANGVIINGHTIVGSQFVLPVGIGISIGNGLQYSAKGASGVGGIEKPRH